MYFYVTKNVQFCMIRNYCSVLLARSFLTELSNIVNNTADDTVNELLQRYNADQLQIPEEELWAVEAPVIPEPEPEPGT